MNDFDDWNNLKKKLNVNQNFINIKERNIYFINFGKNIGFEENGKGKQFLRPVLVVKKFNKNLFLGLPLTTSNLKNKNSKFYYKIYIKNKENRIIFSQIKTFDTKRIFYKIDFISVKDFLQIKKLIKQMLD